MEDKILDLQIDISARIVDVLKLMNIKGRKLLLVFDVDKFVGVVSIGDIQRAIISNISLEECASKIIRSNFKFATEHDSYDIVKHEMMKHRMEFMPIVDDNFNLVDVVFWDDIVEEKYIDCGERFNLPVVIMAGGFGSRLKPLTNVLPKPLIPIGEKTLIEDIMDKFVVCGSKDFYLSVNYKADFIKNYFAQQNNLPYNLSYFEEDKPLGTAGSLSLLKNKITTTFFVSNCDILIDEDYSQILKYHRENQNEITLVVAVKTFSIPYGVVNTKENGLMESLSEKPTLTFKINTGMYILEPHLLNEIPEDTFFHITHLMEKVVARGGKVGCFPIAENSWTDIGDWKEYMKFLK